MSVQRHIYDLEVVVTNNAQTISHFCKSQKEFDNAITTWAQGRQNS